ncbi:MAG: hypothetical protein JWO90_2725 [Solirubrobacterales bacterium]|jgi:hypothetical protein|nr:hypothetical protein [Solirubrobacterales bacterium]
MSYLLDLLQGAGLAAANGIRPFLPAVLAGLLASANVGLDYDGTSFEFLENPIFLGLLTALAIGAVAARKGLETERGSLALGAAGIALGVLSAAGSLDDRSSTWWPGIPVGLLCAALAFVVARSLLTRVRARLDDDAAGALPAYAEVAALVTAGLSILFPPLALVALGLLVRLQLGGRRREGEKYAGLRILR